MPREKRTYRVAVHDTNTVVDGDFPSPEDVEETLAREYGHAVHISVDDITPDEDRHATDQPR